MGRAHNIAVAAAAAFVLAAAIITAQAPAGQKPDQAAAGQKPNQPPAAQPGGPPPNPADPSLPQGQGGGRGAGAPVIQAARAAIKGSNEMTGTATLYEIANGANAHMVQIIVVVENAPPGMHAVHIHGTGRCEGPDFKSAGGHFDPGPAGNPDPDVNHPYHMGDLPNITVNAAGTGQFNVYSTRVTMGGPTGLFDADGSAIVIHQNLDPMVPGPTGSGVSGGTPIACGVIER
jgi:Cu-Zn family superoxide dismutase